MSTILPKLCSTSRPSLLVLRFFSGSREPRSIAITARDIYTIGSTPGVMELALLKVQSCTSNWATVPDDNSSARNILAGCGDFCFDDQRRSQLHSQHGAKSDAPRSPSDRSAHVPHGHGTGAARGRAYSPARRPNCFDRWTSGCPQHGHGHLRWAPGRDRNGLYHGHDWRTTSRAHG